MKWSSGLDPELDLAGYRYVCMKYRGVNLRPQADYALCFLGKSRDGSAYDEVVRGTDLRDDGQWHTVVVPLGMATAKVAKASGIAVQVQANNAPAELDIERVWLASRVPDSAVAEVLPYTSNATFDGFAPVDLARVCNQSLAPVLQALHLTAWPDASNVTISGVPFRFGAGPSPLAATGIRDKTRLQIPVECKASQVFVLMLAVLRGEEDPVYGGGAFRCIADVDRFGLDLLYDDGSTQECLPGNVGSGQFEVQAGAQVLCATADDTKVLQAVTIRDSTDQGGFAVAAITCRTSGGRLFPIFDEVQPPETVKRWATPRKPGPVSIAAEADGACVVMRNGLLKARFDTKQDWLLRELRDEVATRDLIHPEKPQPWFTLTVDGKVLRPEEVGLAGADKRPDIKDERLEMTFDVPACPGLQLDLAVGFTGEGGLLFRGRLANHGSETHTMGITVPQIGPYILGDNLADNEYVFPCRAAVIGRDAADLSERYSGTFGVQFMATASPSAGEGLYLRTEDESCIERSYQLHKDAQGMRMAVSYPVRPLAPGETRALADTILAISDGDWHAALDDYVRWLKTWYRPASPRKAWFREVFNFRQRFLHWLDPLYDPNTGVIDLPRAITEANEQFGGADYLHLFDWGNCGPYGRIYGRAGDYSPYDYIKGGLANLHDTIAQVRASGTPVGLYIEGYLLDERGKLGVAHGAEWQLRGPNGERQRWPESTELFICPGIEPWRDVQAATYGEKVRELDVDGMYIDEFGFTGHDKNCYSADHGHPVPSYPVQTELATTQSVRQAVETAKAGVAIYTEESPCDVTSQYQDGSFTYAMNQAHARRTAVPLNLFRFAVPDFKTFEILICDKPTGSWATGVYWTLFNGEGLWLEGPADQWFSPETRAAIRKCHAILRQHREAFTTPSPCPLVPTSAGACVYANYFPSEHEEVWTLYNARHITYRGEVLRVPRREEWTWRDAWHDAAPSVRADGECDVVSAEIGAQGVGCLVRTRR